jgi:SnoaL-like polyketide cyclase
MVTEGPQARSPGEIVREDFDALFGGRDPDALRPYWREQRVIHFLALGLEASGVDQMVAFFKELFAAFPDWRMTFEGIVADDHHAVVQWIGRGTFDGARFQGSSGSVAVPSTAPASRVSTPLGVLSSSEGATSSASTRT